MGFLRNILPVAGGVAGGILGSAFPGVGTAIGAGLGLTAGGLIGSAIDPATGEVVPTQVPQIDQNIANPTTDQASFLDALRKKYDSGLNLPSIAEQTLKQKTNENVNTMAAAMGSIRGMENPALMGQEIANKSALINQQAIQQGSLLRAQESLDQEKIRQQQSQDLLGAYEANRKAKLDLAATQAGLTSAGMRADADQRSAAIKADSDFMGNLGLAGATLAARGLSSPQTTQPTQTKQPLTYKDIEGKY